jgi:predicted nucleotidyltransferase
LETAGAISSRHHEHQRNRVENVALDIAEEHARIVRDILNAHLPCRAQIWVFGSRATGRARRYSDLDLAIDAGRRLTLDEYAILTEAFSESDLPYRVDIVDWNAIDEHFRCLIEAERVSLHRLAQAETSGGSGNPLC